MMCKFDRAETILNNMLELYNMEMYTDYTFEQIDIKEDDIGVYAFAVVKELPFLYFSVYISTITDYFAVNIFEAGIYNPRKDWFAYDNFNL